MSTRRYYNPSISAVPSKTQQEQQDEELLGFWECSKRGSFFKAGMGAIVLILLLILGASFGMAIYSTSTLVTANTQSIHFIDGQLGNVPVNHVLMGTIPLAITLPNDLTTYVGNLYSVDCASAAAHTITIAPGPLPTAWQGVQRVATCAGVGAGFSFRVVTPSLVRLIDPRNVVFS